MSPNLSDRFGRLLIAGVSWIVMLYLALPLFVVIAMSFTTTEYLKFPPEGLTLRWYWKVVSDPTFVEAFVVSGQLAAAATAMALLLGVPAALVFARKQFPGGRALSALFLASVISNPLLGSLSDRRRKRWIVCVLCVGAALIAVR